MKKFLIIFIILFVLTGCKDEIDKKYYCKKDSDCANCCSDECVNYDWWNKNAPKIECYCDKSCSCESNICTSN